MKRHRLSLLVMGMSVIMGVPVIVRMTVIMRMIGICTNALHMVVMTLLSQADLVFGTDNLHAVLTKLTIHIRIAVFDFLQFFHKSVDDFRMVV